MALINFTAGNTYTCYIKTKSIKTTFSGSCDHPGWVNKKPYSLLKYQTSLPKEYYTVTFTIPIGTTIGNMENTIKILIFNGLKQFLKNDPNTTYSNFDGDIGAGGIVTWSGTSGVLRLNTTTTTILSSDLVNTNVMEFNVVYDWMHSTSSGSYNHASAKITMNFYVNSSMFAPPIIEIPEVDVEVDIPVQVSSPYSVCANIITEEGDCRITESSEDFRFIDGSSDCCDEPICEVTTPTPDVYHCYIQPDGYTNSELYIRTTSFGNLIKLVFDQDDACDVSESEIPIIEPDILPLSLYNNIASTEYLKLERIGLGKKALSYQTRNNYSFIAQYESDKKSKTYKFFDVDKNVDINNLYNSVDFEIQNTLTTYKESNMKGPLGDIRFVIQCGSHVLYLKNNIAYGNHWTHDEHIEYEDLSIAVYNINELKGLVNNTDSTMAAISSIFDTEIYNDSLERMVLPTYKLGGLKWDFVTDSEQDLLYYDFANGKMVGNSFKMKNPFNMDYNIQSSVSGNTSVLSGELRNVRRYTNMRDSNKIWLSYTDNENYTGSRSVISNKKSNRLEKIPLTQTTATTNIISAYQQIETIKGLKYLNGGKEKKSNIYSIRLLDTGLNENIFDEDLRKKLQSGIEVSIRELCEKYTPVHTKLWKIIWEGR